MKNVPPSRSRELIETLQRHFADLHRHQPLRLLVADILAAFDREEEVLGKALFDDLLRRFAGRAASAGMASARSSASSNAFLTTGRGAAGRGRRNRHRPARRRPAGEVGDLLDQVDLADHQPRLGVVVEFARTIEHPDVAGEIQLRFVFVGDAHVVGGPRDAAGEVADFDRDLAGQFTVDVPLQGVVAARREGRIDEINLVLIVQDAEVDAGRDR